ncbi:MAG: aldo/keto reductase [Promethearchaeota archaeon]|nr:MAG: aldo/keto reductase [Candidatus Lokiarchaeota archaeon]
MKYKELGKTGEKLPVIGQGTHGIVPNKSKAFYQNWKNALRLGIELGMTHIDTAEKYGDGYSERLVGDIIKEYNRDELFITTKILPSHKTEEKLIKATNLSLKRLGLKNIDLLLIHWLEPYNSIKTIVNTLEKLIDLEKTRYIGVSNFSLEEFQQARRELKKYDLVTNQIKINVNDNIHIQECLPYYQDIGVTLTAYSPFDGDGLRSIPKLLKEKLENLAVEYNSTLHQIALAWIINHENIITIPKASNPEHIYENAKAAEINLNLEELKQFYLQAINGFH